MVELKKKICLKHT